MTLIDQTLINIILGGGGILGGWFIKAIWDSLKELKETDDKLANKVQAIEVVVVGEYLKRDEFKEEFKTYHQAIFAKLDKIESKVDSKADKS